jgi:hypothetical protein
MFWKSNKEPRAEIKEKLKAVCNNFKLERDSLISNFNDTFSLTCFVNDDIPEDTKILYVSECIADFMFFYNQKSICQEWFERQKLTSKKNKIICFKIPAEDMSILYSDHLRAKSTSGISPFHNTSVINYGGISYPMAFCLGFVWGNNLKAYMKYDWFSI